LYRILRSDRLSRVDRGDLDLERGRQSARALAEELTDDCRSANGGRCMGRMNCGVRDYLLRPLLEH